MNRRGFLLTSAAGTLAGTRPARGEEEWTSLFDGRTLDGWHPWPKARPDGAKWQVEDGAVTGTQGPDGRGSLLMTDQAFGDVQVLVDLKPDWGIDSGFFVRSTDRGRAWQVAVDYCQGGYVGQIYGQGLGGWNTRTFGIRGKLDAEGRLVGLDASPRKLPPGARLAHAITPEQWLEAWTLGKWNTLKVRVVGQLPRITTWLNGAMVVDFDAASYEHPRFDRKEVAKIAPRRGRIALQIHGGKARWQQGAKCRWKNIRLRPCEH